MMQELIEWIKENKPTKEKLVNYKIKLCKEKKIKHPPKNLNILLHAKEEDIPLIRPYLQTKPVRTGSGVAIVATMTKPFNCPHGSCTYCPGGLKSIYGDVPKSYTGKEPSTMRGIRNEYDPYRIIFNRLEHYIVMGQSPQKVDQIIMGGTFTAYPKSYKNEYIINSFKAYNDFSTAFYEDGKLNIKKFKDFFELPGEVDDPSRAAHIKERVLALKILNPKTLEEEQKINETAAIRCIGLTIETKPDWGFKEQGLEMLDQGTTRVELGIQTVYDEILLKINRGHNLEDTKRSIAELRDLGFKLNFHMMPGLPTPSGERISRERDIASMKEIFTNPDYCPDMLKIYPCMVMPGTELYNEYKEGKFIPLTTKEAADIIVEGKKFVPEYCRIMRVQRDIPTYVTEAGVDRTNLRQYVSVLADERGIKCRCIRCREIGRGVIEGDPEMVVREYEAANGKEFFISMEADDKVLGFARLRFPPRSLHPAITSSSALLRELHVYGSALGLGKKDNEKTQHKGFGKKLMAKAEELCKEHNKNKLVVISGVGVRGYYAKMGYSREGPYMVKEL